MEVTGYRQETGNKISTVMEMICTFTEGSYMSVYTYEKKSIELYT